MYSLNYVKVIFSFMTLFIILLGSLINSFEKFLPICIKQSFRYGKFAYTGRPTFIKPLEVPKSWFKHFYIYSSVLTVFILCLTISTLVFGLAVPQSILTLFDFIGGNSRRARVTGASVVLATTLLTIQCLRRLYDTHYVSIFGKNSRMNLSHYLIGYIHYTGAALAVLLEAPKFASTPSSLAVFSLTDLSYIDITAALLFLWSWWHQYKVTVILANLRKNKKGSVVTEAHKLPHGDWFDYVSSPHLLSEILMYFALTIILWNNITWLYVFAWVLSNQVETALLSHWWYQQTFSDLPKHRKAIIPFIY